MNILFVCSRNKWRSLTAETIFKNNQVHNVKSAGTENSARIRITEKLVNWSDLIFVMEKKHKQRIKEKFGSVIGNKEIIVLGIQDDFEYMDEELIEILKNSVFPYFDS
jgi:predicted protein tyrosine phosphatase